MTSQVKIFFLIFCLFSPFNILFAEGSEEKVKRPLELSLDDLFKLRVTSVSGTAQRLKYAPAAISVITYEDMKKQGHQNIAEALRSIPGFHVGQINSNTWAVSSRGFNSRFANKLLVLVDGRSVYTPLFSGVFWDIQDMVLEDIARIEVIRGPGATLWGANAVNGVINIVTKHSRETSGGYVKVGGGSHHTGIGSLRYGDQFNDDLFWRIYGKYSNNNHSYQRSGAARPDDWDVLFAGLRLDWQADSDNSFTLHLNLNNAHNFGEGSLLASGNQDVHPAVAAANPGVQFSFPQTAVNEQVVVSSHNLQLRWDHQIDPTEAFYFKFYYDFERRRVAVLEEDRRTFDFDFRHWTEWNAYNTFIWGTSLRTIKDNLNFTDSVSLTKEKERRTTYSAFMQNTTFISDDFSVMLGSKIETNSTTGLEVQPSLRLTYTYSEDTVFWAALSRAVRTPTRVDNGVILKSTQNNLSFPNPVPTATLPFGTIIAPNGFIFGDKNKKSEELIAYELGMRQDYWDQKLKVDLALFYHYYSNLSGISSHPDGNPTHQIIVDDNHGESYGAELSVKWQVNDWLDIHANYTYFQLELHGSDESGERDDPSHMFNIRADMKLNSKWSWHNIAYYTDSIAEHSIPSYIRWDSGLIYSHSEKLEFSIWGKNLLDPLHEEYIDSFFADQRSFIPRSIFAQVIYKF